MNKYLTYKSVGRGDLCTTAYPNMQPPSLLSNPSNPNLASALPSSSLPTFSRLCSSLQYSTLLPFGRKFNSRSIPSLSFSPYNSQYQAPQLLYDEEEHVIGDCVVFDDGIFEDPYLEEESKSPVPSDAITAQKSKRKKKPITPEYEPQNLVPEQWQQVVEEINITKKERRKISQELEFGQRIDKKKRESMPLRSINSERYLNYKNQKLSQLNPVVLDNPGGVAVKDENNGENDEVDDSLGSSDDENIKENKRVEPKNPRWAVYGRNLDDISDFFNSGSYQPGDSKSEGRGKLFSKEEKSLMNSKFPNLAISTSRKWLLLQTLAASGEFHLLNNLVKHNVDINAADQDGLTALHKAVISKKQAVTSYLLRESANPFVCDKDGATLMHYAVWTASSQAIKILLLYNVDINRQDNDGWTPLHLAVQARRTDVVRLLLIKGADKTQRNRDGITPLELVLYSGRDMRTYELIKLLKQLPKPHKPMYS